MNRKYSIMGLIAAITVLSTALVTVNGDWAGSLLHRGGFWWKISPASAFSVDDVQIVKDFTVIWTGASKTIKIVSLEWNIKKGMIIIELDHDEYQAFIKTMPADSTMYTEVTVTVGGFDYFVQGPSPARRAKRG